MVIAGRSVHITTLFLGKLEQAVNQYYVYILSLVTDNNPSGREENDSRNYFITKRKYVQEVLVNCLFKLAQEKCG